MLKPDQASVLTHLGSIYSYLNIIAATLRATADAIRLTPNDPTTLQTRIVALVNAGHFDEAIGCLERYPEDAFSIAVKAFIYVRMKLPIAGKTPTAYNSMFYAITGTFVLLLIIGVGFSVITAFRYMGGRTSDREIVSAHALYWYFLGVLFFALWFVVYVTK